LKKRKSTKECRNLLYNMFIGIDVISKKYNISHPDMSQMEFYADEFNRINMDKNGRKVNFNDFMDPENGILDSMAEYMVQKFMIEILNINLKMEEKYQ